MRSSPKTTVRHEIWNQPGDAPGARRDGWQSEHQGCPIGRREQPVVLTSGERRWAIWSNDRCSSGWLSTSPSLREGRLSTPPSLREGRLSTPPSLREGRRRSLRGGCLPARCRLHANCNGRCSSGWRTDHCTFSMETAPARAIGEELKAAESPSRPGCGLRRPIGRASSGRAPPAAGIAPCTIHRPARRWLRHSRASQERRSSPENRRR